MGATNKSGTVVDESVCLLIKVARKMRQNSAFLNLV